MSEVSNITINGNTYDLKDTQARKMCTYYGTCATARNVINKTCTIDGFELVLGVLINVLFTNTGTSNPSTGTMTMNVSNTGAIPIVVKNTKKVGNVDYSMGEELSNGRMLTLMYNGSQWVWIGRDTNTVYTFNTPYNSSTNKVATMKDISNAVENKADKSDLETLTNWKQDGNWYYRIVGKISGKNVYEMCYRASHSVAMTQIFSGEYFNNTPLQIDFPSSLSLSATMEITTSIQGNNSLYSPQILNLTGSYFTLWIKSTVSITKDLTICAHCYVY